MFKYFKNNFTKFEKYWFVIFSLTILAVTFYFSATQTDWKDWKSICLNFVVSPLSTMTGIITVVLCAKGDINNYSFGIVNSVTYGLIAWVSGYYGDWLLNWFYFVPTQILILYEWRRNLRNKTSNIVVMRRLSIRQALLSLSFGIVALIGFGLLLYYVDHWFVNYMKRSASIYSSITKAFGIPLLGPMFDSSTEVLQIMAQILLIKRFAEQWALWIATNVITVIMWAAVILTDHSSFAWSVPTMLMWLAFLVNSIYGAYIWYGQSKTTKAKI